VSREEVLPQKADQMVKYSTLLIKNMAQQADGLLAELNPKHAAKTKSNGNYYLQKIKESHVESLIVALGVISSQLAYVSLDGQAKEIRGRLQKLVQVSLLPNLSELFSGYDLADIQGTSTINQTKIKASLKQSERQNFDLFMQLAFQALQICKALHD